MNIGTNFEKIISQLKKLVFNAFIVSFGKTNCNNSLWLDFHHDFRGFNAVLKGQIQSNSIK